MSYNQATDQELLQIIEEAARNKETRLYFDFRQLTILPEAITQLSNLTVLCLRNNQLTTLPESIAQLSNLTALDLSNNQLTTLPESIAQLSNLTVLFLGNNQLTTLPDSITQLSNLRNLCLSKNRLTTLPESIAQLSNLTVLDLSDNKLTTLPEAIKQLSQLEKLDLRENRLNIPAKILGSSWYGLGKPSEILNYYFPVQTEYHTELQAFIECLGSSTVGPIRPLGQNYFESTLKGGGTIRFQLEPEEYLEISSIMSKN
ncbi:MAG: leucine-rich repeat domain-containing protein [Dolichospermum sp.]